jgi:hypothetical protein
LSRKCGRKLGLPGLPDLDASALACLAWLGGLPGLGFRVYGLGLGLGGRPCGDACRRGKAGACLACTCGASTESTRFRGDTLDPCLDEEEDVTGEVWRGVRGGVDTEDGSCGRFTAAAARSRSSLSCRISCLILSISSSVFDCVQALGFRIQGLG